MLVILKRSQRYFSVRESLGSSIKREENNRAQQKVEVQLRSLGEPVAKQLND